MDIPLSPNKLLHLRPLLIHPRLTSKQPYMYVPSGVSLPGALADFRNQDLMVEGIMIELKSKKLSTHRMLGARATVRRLHWGISFLLHKLTTE